MLKNPQIKKSQNELPLFSTSAYIKTVYTKMHQGHEAFFDLFMG